MSEQRSNAEIDPEALRIAVDALESWMTGTALSDLKLRCAVRLVTSASARALVASPPAAAGLPTTDAGKDIYICKLVAERDEYKARWLSAPPAAAGVVTVEMLQQVFASKNAIRWREMADKINALLSSHQALK